MAQRFWTCQRQQAGRKCGTKNSARLQKCQSCGKRRPPRKEPEHRAVLKLVTYEQCVAVFGDKCMICGSKAQNIKLSRDHDHKTGILRGLLCFRCNSGLKNYMTLDWLLKAVEYLVQAEERECGEDGRPLLFSEERADTMM